MSRKRVVVTGLSAITPLGNDVESSWTNLLDGKCGIDRITHFDTTEFDSKIAAEIKGFDPENFGISAKQARRMDRFTQIGVAAGKQLVENSGLKITDDNAGDVGTIVGIGLGGIQTIENFHSKLMTAGPGKVSPFYIPMLISNMGTGQIAIATGAKGINIVATSACASGLHAIGSAYSEILLGRCSAVITGGLEATITPMAVSGFIAMKALCSNMNDNPQKASRPFDKNRSGFVMGEGAGLLMLEDLEHATKRGAKIYAEIVGVGASCDAYHMTAPCEDGEGAIRAMRNALRDAGLEPDVIDYINAHGTSTGLNDQAETLAIKKVFGERAYQIPVSSNKGQIGHLLGGAGGVESVFSVLALQNGVVPQTLNYETPDPECDLDYVPEGPRKKELNYVQCNNFGFGGTNGSVIFKRWDNK